MDSEESIRELIRVTPNDSGQFWTTLNHSSWLSTLVIKGIKGKGSDEATQETEVKESDFIYRRGRSHGTVVSLHDLKSCPSWVQV